MVIQTSQSFSIEYIKLCFFSPQNEISGSKLLFPEHLPLSRIQAGIKSGAFLQGTFRANRDNYLEATVFIHGEGDKTSEVGENCQVSFKMSVRGFFNFIL